MRCAKARPRNRPDRRGKLQTMNDAAPILPPSIDSPRRDRRFMATAVLSAVLHVLLLAWLLLPLTPALAPAEPQSVDVELVQPSEVISLKPDPSSEAPSSEAPLSESPSSEAASSAEPPSS